MLPYLAASDHDMYTGSARMYPQQMANLKEEHPDAHQPCHTEFDGGETSDEHTFRRTDQVVTLSTKSSIKIDGDDVQVDP